MGDYTPENMWHIYGPPGTGKTTYLTQLVRDAVAKHGPANVLVSSFTRAAAAEISSRGLQVERQMVGTLHAIARRALGKPIIAEGIVGEWNALTQQGSVNGQRNVAYGLELSDKMIKGGEPESGGSTLGDELYQTMQLYRARMWDVRVWPDPRVVAFHRAWSGWKRDNDVMDFTDLIEVCLQEIEKAPGGPTVGFFDEVQDFTPLELSLVRKWGAQMQFFMLAGDDDQCLYHFKGATPEAFLDPAALPEQKRLLRQSHRVPRQVQALAQQWIMRVARREPKGYLPRDEEGVVRYANGLTFKDAPRLIEHAEYYLAQGKSVMFIGACGYHVDPLKFELRRQGIPFENKYRRTRADWNPLRASHGVSTPDRIMAFVAPRGRVEVTRRDGVLWTADELKAWAHMVRAQGVFVHGAKTVIERTGGKRPLKIAELARHFAPGMLEQASACTPVWLEAHLAGAAAKTADYPLRVVSRRGVEALTETPAITIGTIHSVKGGEADVVYLFPDLSMGAMAEWTHNRDPIVRQYYVGMTRARETLVMTRGVGFAVPLPKQAPIPTVETI